LIRKGTRFTGIIRNTGTAPLQRVCLLWGSGAILLGDLAPGAELTVDESLPSSSYGYDTLESIAGGQLYGANSRDTYRRRALASAALSSPGTPYYYGAYGTVRTPTAHIYLTAWIAGFPGEASLDGAGSLSDDLTMLLIQVPKDSERTLVKLLDDRDMDWKVIEPPGGGFDAIDLYNMQLDAGRSAAFEFTPHVPFKPEQAVRLALTIDSYNTGNAAPIAELWDWSLSRWIKQDAMDWGTPLIVEPAVRYLDAKGVLRLRFTAPPGDMIFLSGFHLDLEGTP
jgi:hypothetical protein